MDEEHLRKVTIGREKKRCLKIILSSNIYIGLDKLFFNHGTPDKTVNIKVNSVPNTLVF